jgi:hypothetical protein
LPWTAPFLGGLWRAVRHPFGTDPRGPALAAWILGVAVFFSTSHSKLATYILPVIPHACLLAVAAIGDGVPRWAWRLGRLLGGLMIAAAVAGLVVLGFGLVPTDLWPIKGLSPRSLHWLIALSAALMTSLGAAQWVAASSHRPVRALSCGGALAGFFLFFGLRLAAPLISSRNIAGEVRRQAEGNDALWTYGTYLHGLPFYTRRLVDTLVLFTGEFHYAKRDPAYSPRFGDDDAVRALPREGGKTFVVMRSGERPHFQELVAGGIESWQEFGPWSLAVVRRR